MKYSTIIITILFALNLTAQEVVVEYPYNPDFENDGNVGVEDLMQLLASFGMGFDVDELTIDEVALSEWLQAISETLIAQQSVIDSLSSIEPAIMEFDSLLFENLGLAFGEHTHLSEPEDWGPFPLQPQTFYSGTYDFNQDGICFGYFMNSFYGMYLLPDSIDLANLSDDEFYDDFQVVAYPGSIMGSGLKASFSIPVKAEEKIIVRGLENAFDNSFDHNLFWRPIELSMSPGLNNGDETQISVENTLLDSSCRCWPDQGEIVVELPEADFVYLEVEPYLTGQGNTSYDSYNCFKFKLPDGTGFTSMTIIPPHISNIIPPSGSEGDGLDALLFQIYSSNFIGQLNYDGGIDNYSWGPHAGWHAWRFIRDHNGDWRPQTTQP